MARPKGDHPNDQGTSGLTVQRAWWIPYAQTLMKHVVYGDFGVPFCIMGPEIIKTFSSKRFTTLQNVRKHSSYIILEHPGRFIKMPYKTSCSWRLLGLSS